MGKCVFADGTVIQDYKRPYIIAEVNSSHNGNMDTARKMIDAAAMAGCDCVKFQSWSASSLYSKSYYNENPIAKRFVTKFSLAPNQLKELSEYCRSKGISFSSTPYSKEEVDYLIEECRVPFIKIASMELNNFSFLDYIGKKGVPVVLSTGMGETNEIREAVRVIETAGNRHIILLHCVSVYPVETEQINLNNIIAFREMFPEYPIGFSDHTLGDEAAVAATALGAAVLEKHMTLDSKKIGMDNQMAMEPSDLEQLVSKCRRVNRALGKRERVVTQDEYEQRKKMRRSIVTARNLSKGTILTVSDLAVKRPGTGIPPDQKHMLLGRMLKHDMEADMLICLADLEAEI